MDDRVTRCHGCDPAMPIVAEKHFAVCTRSLQSAASVMALTSFSLSRPPLSLSLSLSLSLLKGIAEYSVDS
jgi:hypothetical protein